MLDIISKITSNPKSLHLPLLLLMAIDPARHLKEKLKNLRNLQEDIAPGDNFPYIVRADFFRSMR